jgi:hypothetical protein
MLRKRGIAVESLCWGKGECEVNVHCVMDY